MNKCEHVWVLYFHDENGIYAVKFRFYCSKCLKFKNLQAKDMKYED